MALAEGTPPFSQAGEWSGRCSNLSLCEISAQTTQGKLIIVRHTARDARTFICYRPDPTLAVDPASWRLMVDGNPMQLAKARPTRDAQGIEGPAERAIIAYQQQAILKGEGDCSFATVTPSLMRMLKTGTIAEVSFSTPSSSSERDQAAPARISFTADEPSARSPTAETISLSGISKMLRWLDQRQSKHGIMLDAIGESKDVPAAVLKVLSQSGCGTAEPDQFAAADGVVIDDGAAALVYLLPCGQPAPDQYYAVIAQRQGRAPEHIGIPVQRDGKLQTTPTVPELMFDGPNRVFVQLVEDGPRCKKLHSWRYRRGALRALPTVELKGCTMPGAADWQEWQQPS
ncbi:hypothetical protein [Rhodoligotrophos ferricapiens]|uniref:hypothetical protein n=1 Tax=Rhodoligotrophos ferricapiens TaxID=3069264 RepID=UPI00315D6B0F